MKIGVGGCSHTSEIYGNPWWFYMSEDLNSEIIPSSSGASGNEKNLEKIKYIYDSTPDLDLFVYQITEPSRMVVGIEQDPVDVKEYLNDMGGETFNVPVPYYTFNSWGNDNRIKEFYGYDVNFDNFFIEKIFTSDYNIKHKLFHTLMSIQYLSDLYDKKIIFFSWFLDIHKLAEQSNHTKTIKKMNILNGFVENFTKKHNIPKIINDSHYGSESQKRIYYEFIQPQLISYL